MAALLAVRQFFGSVPQRFVGRVHSLVCFKLVGQALIAHGQCLLAGCLCDLPGAGELSGFGIGCCQHIEQLRRPVSRLLTGLVRQMEGLGARADCGKGEKGTGPNAMKLSGKSFSDKFFA
jgi:hypothetical protein